MDALSRPMISIAAASSLMTLRCGDTHRMHIPSNDKRARGVSRVGPSIHENVFILRCALYLPLKMIDLDDSAIEFVICSVASTSKFPNGTEASDEKKMLKKIYPLTYC